ncbi:MAG: glycerophosphodiester phosphodiesterase [Myxococcota bacterium]
MRPARPLVIAHRGASAYRPENTLPAYELAVELRAAMIEIDLHRTRDGEIVITHDEELAGLGGEGEIADALAAEVRGLDAGGGERVPTLAEVLDRFGPQIPFNLEIKRGAKALYSGIEEQALRAVSERSLGASILWSSFHDPVLARLRALEPGARLAFLVSPRDAERPVERALAVGAEAINPWHGMASPEFVAEAHGEGLAVYPFTVDAPDAMERLLERGVDGLFTNHPDRLRDLLRAGEPAADRQQPNEER